MLLLSHEIVYQKQRHIQSDCYKHCIYSLRNDDALDIKRPHIIALGYTEANVLINKNALLTMVQNLIGSNTFTSFTLLNADNESIDEESLGIGVLAYLSKLTINNEVIYDADAAEDEDQSDE